MSGKQRPICVMMDGNVHDAIVADHIFKELICRRQDENKIVLKGTHIEEGELAAIPPVRDVGQRKVVSKKPVSTAVIVPGASYFGRSNIGSPETRAAFRAIKAGNAKNVNDAIIGATAVSQADILVTDDKKFAKKFRALNSRAQVLSSREFHEYLETL